MKILMVCLGNICRSPLAEGIMKAKVKEAGLDWEVESAGTGAYHVGELPDHRSIAVGKKYGIDITDQRARQFRPIDIDRFDMILAMDAANYNDIKKHSNGPDDDRKIHLIMNFVDPGMNQSVPDPYWANDGFENVYKMLENACKKIIKVKI